MSPASLFVKSLPGQSYQSAQLPHTHRLCSEPGMVVNRQIPPIFEAEDLLLPLSESLPSLVLPLLGLLFGRKSPSPHCTRMRFLPIPRMVPLPHFPKPCLEEKKITVLRQGFLPSSSQFWQRRLESREDYRNLPFYFGNGICIKLVNLECCPVLSQTVLQLFHAIWILFLTKYNVLSL